MRLMVVAAFVAAGTGMASAAEVMVEVAGVQDAAGQVRVAACTEAEFLKTCRLIAAVPARAGRVGVTLRGVPPGRYAIQAHHDRDGDGRIARNLIGIPTEGVGFSRAPAMRFGPPSFADAAVDVGGSRLTVPVGLQFGGNG